MAFLFPKGNRATPRRSEVMSSFGGNVFLHIKTSSADRRKVTAERQAF